MKMICETQLAMNLTGRRSGLAVIRDYMLRHGDWRTPYEIREQLLIQGFHTNLSDAGITARLRDLRKIQFGAYQVDKRIRKGSNSREYRVKVA